MSRSTWQVFHKAFDDQFCDDVISIAKNYEWDTGRVGSGPNGTNIDKNARSSKVKMLDAGQERHITEAIYNIVSHANMQTFAVDIQGCFELQYTSYKKGDFYGPHIDVFWRKPEEAPKFDRKLSCSVLLNDPAEFEGGELIVEGDKLELNQRGAVAVFPSYIQHEVLPVTKGTRLSLVSWVAGPEWR